MEKAVTKTNSILLIDESFDFDDIKKFLNNTTKIISFDISSHKFLEKQNIKHISSDSFLSENDYKEIQEKSYELEQWYNSEELKQSLLFENINLGQLTYVDTVYHITKSLKIFFEILKIYEKYPQENFITVKTLSKILECFTKSFKNIGGKTKSIQYHENVHYDYKIGKLNIPLNISFKNYKKFKKLSEKFLSLFFNPKNISNEKKSVLLVEFDPIKYADLLLKSKSSRVNFILYNRRRPSIWNKNSFDILKKSGTKIITQNNFEDEKILNECKEKTEYYEQKIFKMLDEQIFLKTFQFREKNLWPIFKNVLLQNILDHMNSEIFEILMAQKVLKSYNIDSIILYSENSSSENILMNTAKKQKIPVLLMQHGIIYDSKNTILRHNLVGIYPNQSDYAIVWGDLMKKHLISLGYDQMKIKSLGCPIYDKINSQVIKNSNTILVTTAPPRKDFAIDLSVNTILSYEKVIKEICNYCKNNNLDLIFKLHPSLEDNIQEIIEENYENAEIISSGSIIPLIKKCSLVIALDLSTTILESQLLSKPVICISFRDNDLNSEIFENSCLRIPIENFKDLVTKILNDNIFRKNLIEKGTNYSNSYLSNKTNSCSSLLNFLEKI